MRTKSSEREARLAKALRENLKRRKDAAKSEASKRSGDPQKGGLGDTPETPRNRR
jgi:hypothetical protein